MSRIESLVQELCPHGVPFAALHEVATTVSGLTGKSKADFSGGNARYVSYKNVFSNLAVDQESVDFVRVAPGERQNMLCGGDVVFTGSSESVDEVGMSSVVLHEPSEPLYLNSFCFAIRFHDQGLFLPGFSKYLFRSDTVRNQIRRSASGVTRINLSKQRFMKLRVPVPPLEVQREIVRILDTFTELEADLEAELEAELEARRQQYAHYRDALLSCAGAPRVPLGDLGEFIRGRRFTWNDVVTEGTPAIHYSEIYTRYGVATAEAAIRVRPELAPQLRFAAPGDVVIAAVGETVEDLAKAVAWLGDEPVAIHDDTFLFRSELNAKYVAYCLQTADFHRQKGRHVARAKVKRISGAGLAQVEIPVMTTDEQVRIVATLDRFDALVNDLSVGLSAELAARRKQYEYYSDRLLSFEEAAS